MTKVLWIDLLREIRKNKGRFFSLMFIVALGVAFFAGIRSSEPDMKKTLDQYYDDQNFTDLRIISTLGLSKADVEAISGLSGVKKAAGIKTVELLTRTSDRENSVEVYNYIPGMNEPYVEKGRMPEKPTEIFIDRQMAGSLEISLGDEITFLSGREEGVESFLTEDTYTVVGYGLIPWYLTFTRGSGELVDGSLDYFAVVLEECFVADYYKEVDVLAEGAKEKVADSGPYEALADKLKNTVEEATPALTERRTGELLEEGIKTALSDKERYEEEYQKAKDKTYQEEKEKAYQEAYQREKEKAYEDALKTAHDTAYEEAYNAAYEEAHDKALLAFRAQVISEAKEKYPELSESQVEANLSLAFERVYLPLFETNFAAQFEQQGRALFDEGFEEGFQKEGVEAVKKAFEASFDEAFSKSFEESFSEAFNQNLPEFDAAFKEEYEKSVRKAVEREIQALPEAKWYVLKRSEGVQNYIEYMSDAEGIGKIGKVFPVLFFLVAALVSLTAMTRMVEEQRTLMGTMKAVGYRTDQIALKYILYALSACLVGGVIGAVIGEWVLPYVVISAYGILFKNLPFISIRFNLYYALLGTAAAVGCVVFATMAACNRALKEKPVSLMRPPAPKNGRRILFEYLPFWKHLSFVQKSSIRNVFRYKKRLLMMVFGISGCMGLLLVGFGLRDSILQIAKYQYKEIFTYDAILSLSVNKEEGIREALYSLLEEEERVEEYTLVHTGYTEVKSDTFSRECVMYVPENREVIGKYLALRDRKKQTRLAFPDEGVALSEKTAKQLSVSVGDTVVLSDSKGQEHRVPVSLIFENYIQHYVLLSEETYESLYGEKPEFLSLLLLCNQMEADWEEDFGARLMKQKAVTEVTFSDRLQVTLDDMLRSLNLVIWVLIISAGMLAFVVMYNLNNINITERLRELATIKVLGFYHGEVAMYIYRDNMILTALGCVAGILVGRFLHIFIIDTVEVDLMMMGRQISTMSVIASILLTIVFSLIVNFAMYFRLKRIDMVESLKSVE